MGGHVNSPYRGFTGRVGILVGKMSANLDTSTGASRYDLTASFYSGAVVSLSDGSTGRGVVVGIPCEGSHTSEAGRSPARLYKTLGQRAQAAESRAIRRDFEPHPEVISLRCWTTPWALTLLLCFERIR